MAGKRFGVLIDLSGTIHIGDTLVKNANIGIKRLIAEPNASHVFLSNTTKESRQSLAKRLCRLGLDIPNEKIFTSLTATHSFLKQRNLRPFCMLSEDAKTDFGDLQQNDPNCVVVGLAPDSFSYEEMNTAFQHVLNGCQIVATHKARYYRSKEDILRLGPGPFVTALEYASGKDAKVIGKPSPGFFQTAIEMLESPDSVYMIGDDVKDDIDGAQKIGIKGILVKTGKYRDGDEQSIEPVPYHTVESFDEAVQYILRHESIQE